ncbi:hypothetical protein ACTWJ8_40355 (plasmid) [Streptomyces sp. SDT5-1]|uniref:hypothetical protein n=1 Tax=Streptomyces sp. SDT5-1 TaxID=3406418 RepID=UPI003FCF70AB
MAARLKTLIRRLTVAVIVGAAGTAIGQIKPEPDGQSLLPTGLAHLCNALFYLLAVLALVLVLRALVRYRDQR